jgi:glycosyltransferase involved in cell wall biosynthesis
MLTFAFCTYNRADRLDKLLQAMRAQEVGRDFEILAVNNNSTDHTAAELARLADAPGPTLRWVTEETQGIVAARNRAIRESLDSDIMVFIDDDETPLPGLLAAADHAITQEGAECVGGRVIVDFSTHSRPRWLGDELLGFLAAVDHGDAAFWIKDHATPIWTANVAYDMSLFRNDPHLRFDARYDRKGNAVGGGSDAVMFRALVDRGAAIRYRPEMAVLHDVEPWRLKRSYFLRLHYRAGLRKGRYELPEYSRTYFGVPPFLITQFLSQTIQAIPDIVLDRTGAIRKGMNASYTLGNLVGYSKRHV